MQTATVIQFDAATQRRLKANAAMCHAIHHHRTIWTRLYTGTAGLTVEEMGPRAARLLNRCSEVVSLIQRLAVASQEGK